MCMSCVVHPIHAAAVHAAAVSPSPAISITQSLTPASPPPTPCAPQGESVAIALTLVGARPVKEGTGRVARFELVPLEELGRPRVDVLCNMSGIFRDSFQNVVELLDDLFQRAAAAEEPLEMNYVRKHAGAMEQQVGPAGVALMCVLGCWGCVSVGRHVVRMGSGRLLPDAAQLQ